MSTTRIKLNLAGFRQLRTTDEVEGLLADEAEKIAQRADSGSGSPGDHAVHVDKGRTRSRAVVITATPDAMLAEAKDRNLTQSVHGG